MTVYIEYVVLDNLIIDLIILLLVKLTTHTEIKKLNMLLCAVMGVCFAIITPLFSCPTLAMAIIKVAYSIVLVIVLKKYANFKEYFTIYMLFISYTFLLGGMCFGIIELFSLPYNSSGLLINGFSIPMGLVILLIYFYIATMIKFVLYLKKRNLNTQNYFDMWIKLHGKKYYIRGFMDTGNGLYDNGYPVAVLCLKVFMKIEPNFSYIKLLTKSKDIKDLHNAHFIDVASVNQSKGMLVFDVDEMALKVDKDWKVIPNAKLGVATSSFNGEFECLLHKGLL